MEGSFKRETTFEKRVDICRRIKGKYPNRIPIIIEIANGSNLNLTRSRFLAPEQISIGGFLNEIRKQTNVQKEEAIFIFCGSGNNVLVPTTHNLNSIYEKYRDEDGFLYLTIALENTFGVWGTIGDRILLRTLNMTSFLNRKAKLNF
jgi:GABA(A) receptor-associated protein